MVILLPGIASADEVRDGQWYLDTLGIYKAHELSQGAGVTIGVIDSGVEAQHPDLEGSVLPGTDFGTSKGEGLEPVDDHDTATASVIVGHGHGNDHANGVLGNAPEAKVISVEIDRDNPARSLQHNADWYRYKSGECRGRARNRGGRIRSGGFDRATESMSP